MNGLNPKDLVGAKKAPLTLVPPSAVIAMAEAMAVGAAKYGPFNWRDQPIQVRTYVEATLRHLYAFLDGQARAEDTGVSHLAHAMAGLAILNDAIALGAIDDNRSTGPAAELLREQDRSVTPGKGEWAKFAEGGAQKDHYDRDTRLHPAFRGDDVVGYDAEGTVLFRGEWPPDTRVGGLLTCCGASEHVVECPQWR